jgi:hypothetical protein
VLPLRWSNTRHWWVLNNEVQLSNILSRDEDKLELRTGVPRVTVLHSHPHVCIWSNLPPRAGVWAVNYYCVLLIGQSQITWVSYHWSFDRIRNYLCLAVKKRTHDFVKLTSVRRRWTTPWSYLFAKWSSKYFCDTISKRSRFALPSKEPSDRLTWTLLFSQLLR